MPRNHCLPAMSDDVFYHSQTGAPWQPFIPPAFLLRLCDSILDGNRDYMRRQSIDPEKLLDQSHLWI
jgi:hypothetical protein